MNLETFIKQNDRFVQVDYRTYIIAENFRKVSFKSFCSFGDRNMITKSIKRKCLSQKGGMSVDVLAQDIQESTGIEITVEDIIQYIINFNDVKLKFMVYENPILNTDKLKTLL